MKTKNYIFCLKLRTDETQVEWLLLNPVNVSFPVTCHSGPPKCPRDRVYNLLGNCKRSIQWFKFNLPILSQPGPLPGVTALPTILGRAKGFPISAMCVLNVKIQYPSLINTLSSYYPCYWHQPNPLFVCCSSHSDGSPPFPSLRFKDLHHSCHYLWPHYIIP